MGRGRMGRRRKGRGRGRMGRKWKGRGSGRRGKGEEEGPLKGE